MKTIFNMHQIESSFSMSLDCTMLVLVRLKKYWIIYIWFDFGLYLHCFFNHFTMRFDKILLEDLRNWVWWTLMDCCTLSRGFDRLNLSLSKIKSMIELKSHSILVFLKLKSLKIAEKYLKIRSLRHKVPRNLSRSQL